MRESKVVPVRANRSIAPLILRLDIWRSVVSVTPRRLHPRRIFPAVHWLRDYVGPQPIGNFGGGEEMTCVPGIEARCLGGPAHSMVTIPATPIRHTLFKIVRKQSLPCTAPDRLWGFQEGAASRFEDRKQIEVVSCQPYAPAAFTSGDIPGTHRS
jgi:hypothetical protein